MDFKDKVVLISGATGGMGKYIVKLIAKEGCKLAIFARNEEKLKKLCKEISSTNTTCIFKKCDVKKKNDVKEAVEFTKEKYGRIDVAILTAGILEPNPLQTFDSSIIIKSMEINFFGNLYFFEYLLPIMKKQKSSIIATTSTLPDKRGQAGWGAYGASKAALSWLIESLRAEAKKEYNIKLITIKPGSVKTDMIQDYYRVGSVDPEKAAKIIVKGVKAKKTIIQFPITQVLLIKIMEMLPANAYDCQPIEGLKGHGYPEVEEY